MPNLTGQYLGRYHIIEQLGEGGMATVYKAFDTRLERQVAIKVIRREAFTPVMLEGVLSRFEREAKALARLSHPNVVHVHDYGEHEGSPYLVMEYIAGGNLKQRTGTPWHWVEAVKLLLPVARALSYAHSQKIIHRDIKPANILITESGEPMLSDFGIAKMLETAEGATLTGTGVGIGTPEYMAPEQGLGRAVDGRTDMYALGVVLFELITGRKPYVSDTPMAVVLKHVTDPLPNPKKFVPDLPDEVANLIFKALAKEPQDRYPDMDSFCAAIDKLLGMAQPVQQIRVDGNSATISLKTVDEKPYPISQPPVAQPITEKAVSNRWLIIGLAGMALLALVVIVIAVGFSWIKRRQALFVTQTAVEAAAVATAQASQIEMKNGFNETKPTATVRARATEVPITETPVQPATNTVTPTSAIRFASADPKTFTLLSASEPVTLDPALDYETAGTEIIRNVYETLIFFNKDQGSQYIPQLATEWQISEDGKTYTFYIRKGVQFHNGNTLTPDDVAYSLQRGLLQGGSGSPQRLFTEPFLGVNISDISYLVNPDGSLLDNAEGMKTANTTRLKTACEKVKAAITANENAGTVTLTLAQPWAPLLATLAQTWGSVMDKEWVISNGGWDGSCSTWQNFYALTAENDPFSEQMNGTGPFQLANWIKGKEIVLVNNAYYWRTEPAWEDGPSGPAAFDRVVIKIVAEWDNRFTMLQAGEADSMDVPRANFAQVDALVGEECQFNDQKEAFDACNSQGDQALRLWKGYSVGNRSDIFFNFDIFKLEGENTFIGSGKLDGEGIPPNFFTDIHVRKAFNYCFDRDAFVQEALGGEGFITPGFVFPGMPGYEPNGPAYTFDLAQCETEFKASELKSSNGQSLWDVGFRLQMLYNTGNVTRQTAFELLASNISKINSRFNLEAVGVPFETYIKNQRARTLPIFIGGWIEDIHDPHQWYWVNLTGHYATMQNLPDEYKSQFQEFIKQGVTEYDPKKRAVFYEILNQQTYDLATMILLAIPTNRHYEQRWVQGWYSNPAYYGNYFYALSKQ